VTRTGKCQSVSHLIVFFSHRVKHIFRTTNLHRNNHLYQQTSLLCFDCMSRCVVTCDGLLDRIAVSVSHVALQNEYKHAIKLHF